MLKLLILKKERKKMEYLKISNELISEVLECNCTNSKIIDNELIYEAFGDSYINIYEFAFKCKEWLIDKGIDISIIYWSKDRVSFYSEECHIDIESTNEISLIIKACNWILEHSK